MKRPRRERQNNWRARSATRKENRVLWHLFERMQRTARTAIARDHALALANDARLQNLAGRVPLMSEKLQRWIEGF